MSASINHSLTVPEECAGSRIDQAVAELLPDYSRSQLQGWIKAGKLTINGEKWRPRDKVSGGEQIVLDAELTPVLESIPEEITLDIIAETNSYLVINKPIGLVVHPGAGNPNGTLMNALLHHEPELRNLPRAGIIHRIDKGTSGLLVIAKTLAAHNHLSQALQEHDIEREYLAIVSGPMTGGGKIDLPLGRHPRDRKKMAVIDTGKPAVTHYRLIERFAAHTYIRVNLETGRTHQIRVHMAHKGYPIIGDAVYGGRPRLPKQASPELIEMLQHFSHQALHAHKLTFTCPETGEPRSFEAPIPADFETLLTALRAHAKAQ